MKLKGEYVFEAPREEVWKALLDPVVLAAVMPGCDKLDLVDGVYKGVLNIKVGPVQGKFNGDVALSDMVAPESYKMKVDGKGQQGFVKADAGVHLTEEGEQTRMAYDADARVGGRIASVGQRLIDASAKAIIKQSLEGLHENIKLRTAHSEKVQQAEAEAEQAEQAAEEALARGDAAAAAKAKETADAAALEAQAVPAPVKKVEAGAMAASVSREVAKELVPVPIRYGVAILVVVGIAYAVYSLFT